MADISISKSTINYVAEIFAEKVYEKLNRQKWHDLRKNPEDLPEDNEMVLVCYKFWDSHNSYKVAWFHNSENDICFYPDGNSRIELSMVIAWRLIELHEEDT